MWRHLINLFKKKNNVSVVKPRYVWIIEYTNVSDENITYISSFYYHLEEAMRACPVAWKPSCIENPPTEYQYRVENKDAKPPYDERYRVVAYLTRYEIK